MKGLFYPPALPQSDDPEEQRSYRRALHVWSVKVTATLAVGAAGFAFAASPYGFARASDIRTKVNAVVEPIAAEVSDLKREVSELKRIQQRDSNRLALSLSNSVASELRFIHSKRCKEPDADERDRLWREAERKQEEFRELRGFYYTVPSCADL